MSKLAPNFTPKAVNGLGYQDTWDGILEGIWYCINESARRIDQLRG